MTLGIGGIQTGLTPAQLSSHQLKMTPCPDDPELQAKFLDAVNKADAAYIEKHGQLLTPEQVDAKIADYLKPKDNVDLQG